MLKMTELALALILQTIFQQISIDLHTYCDLVHTTKMQTLYGNIQLNNILRIYRDNLNNLKSFDW